MQLARKPAPNRSDDQDRRCWFACSRCGGRARLFVEFDSRDCPYGTCTGLMRQVIPRRKPASERRLDARYNPETVPMRPAFRCSRCGGLHWHALSLVTQCPQAG